MGKPKGEDLPAWSDRRTAMVYVPGATSEGSEKERANEPLKVGEAPPDTAGIRCPQESIRYTS